MSTTKIGKGLKEGVEYLSDAAQRIYDDLSFSGKQAVDRAKKKDKGKVLAKEYDKQLSLKKAFSGESTPKSGKGLKEYPQESTSTDFKLSEPYDKTKVPAIIDKFSDSKKKVAEGTRRLETGPKDFVMSDAYDKSSVPAKIKGPTANTPGKYVNPRGRVVEGESVPAKRESNQSTFSGDEKADDYTWLKNIGKVAGAGAVGTGIYKAVNNDDEKNIEHKDLDLSTGIVPKVESRSTKASESEGPKKSNKKSGKEKEFTRKQFSGKLNESVDLGESAEAKLLTARIDKTINNLSKLEDPPMTAVKLRADMFEQLKKDRDNRERSLEWAKLGDRFLAAITKYAAAKEGLARGLDMSNVNIKGSDWDKAIDRAYAKYTEAVKETQDRFDKEDKAKSAVDKSRQELSEKLMDMRGNMSKLRDVRAREKARILERRRERLEDARADHEKQQDLMQRHHEDLGHRKEAEKKREAGRDRRASQAADSRVRAAIVKAKSSSDEQAKLLDHLTNAAKVGNKTFAKTLGSARVLSKLDKEFLKPYMKDTWFGSDKVDTKRLREDLLKSEEERVASRPQTKTVVDRMYSPTHNKTKLIYSDGTEEVVDGKVSD